MKIPGFDRIFPPEEYQNRSKEVEAQNQRLADARAATEKRGSMATPLRPTEASQKASETYSEPTRSMQ